MSRPSARFMVAKRGLAVLGTVVLTAGLATTTNSPANADSPPSGRSSIPGSSPSWTSAAQTVGAPAANQTITFRVALQLRNKAAAEKAAASVSDPKNAQYGKYLTASQFNARYAPTAAQVATVRRFLTSQGISVSGVAQGNRWIDARGTVAQVEQAFAVAMKTYHYRGQKLRATPGPLSAPRSVAGLISGVTGVSQLPSRVRPNHVVAPVDPGTIKDSARANASPNDSLPPPSECSVYYRQHEQTGPLAYGKTSFPTIGCGYTPAQLRGAYGTQSVVKHQNGSGVTVAIIDAYASPTIVADTNQLSAMQGEPQLRPGQYRQTTFAPFDLQDECGGEEVWNEEQTLDVQAVHAMAPGANIHYIGAQNCDIGIDDAVNYVIQNHLADIVSNSYGFVGEDGLGNEVDVEHSLFLQAALQGIGFYFSSGDYGDNTAANPPTPRPEPDYPASDTLVTGVGGTTLEINSASRYLFETAWGDDLSFLDTTTSPSTWSPPPPGDFYFGTGGGVSALFSQPLYQRLAVPRSLATLNGPRPMRVVPDVAAVADPETGFLIIFSGQPVQYGGTSLAAPVFAGFQAVASQHRRTAIGFANPLLYVLGLARVPFHDVTAAAPTPALITPSGQALLTIGKDSSLTATRGYDDTTGLGTPNGIWLLAGESLGR